jgi:ABC-type phosphate/phosphonate transport system permease subunit
MSTRPPASVEPTIQPQGGVKKTDRLLRWVIVALLIVSVIVTTAILHYQSTSQRNWSMHHKRLFYTLFSQDWSAMSL